MTKFFDYLQIFSLITRVFSLCFQQAHAFLRIDYLKDRLVKGELSKQIKSIRDITLTNNKLQRIFSGNDDSWAPSLVEEIQEDLNAGKLNTIAGKHEVSDLTRMILIECGLLNTPEHIGDYLVDMIQVGRHIRYNEWNSMVKLIEK